MRQMQTGHAAGTCPCGDSATRKHQVFVQQGQFDLVFFCCGIQDIHQIECGEQPFREVLSHQWIESFPIEAVAIEEITPFCLNALKFKIDRHQRGALPQLFPAFVTDERFQCHQFAAVTLDDLAQFLVAGGRIGQHDTRPIGQVMVQQGVVARPQEGEQGSHGCLSG